MSTPAEKELALKKRKASELDPGGSVVDNPSPKKQNINDQAIVLVQQVRNEAPAPQPNTEIVLVEFSRLVGQANPEFVQSMRDAGELGYSRPAANINPENRTYTLLPTRLRDRFSAVLQSALTLLYHEHGTRTLATATALATADAILTC